MWFSFLTFAQIEQDSSRGHFLFDDFDGFDRQVQPKVHFVTMTVYDETYHCPVAFQPQTLDNILGKVVSEAGKKQLRIAETEKYPHVTYFFNGGDGSGLSRRGSGDCPVAESRDLRPQAGDERVGSHGRGA